MEASPSLELTAPAAPQLHESRGNQPAPTWPFQTIRPQDYWALSEAQRRVVEQTVNAMIRALHSQDANRKS